MAAKEKYRITPEASHTEFLAATKLYARSIIAAHELAIDVANIDWTVSTRAKRRAGVVKHNGGTQLTIGLTWGYFEQHGWDGITEIIRHELIHAHLLTKYDDGTHGDRFLQLADQLDTSVHCQPFTEPSWWIVCETCDSRVPRYNRSKVVTHPEQYECGSCGSQLRVVSNTTA